MLLSKLHIHFYPCIVIFLKAIEISWRIAAEHSDNFPCCLRYFPEIQQQPWEYGVEVGHFLFCYQCTIKEMELYGFRTHDLSLQTCITNHVVSHTITNYATALKQRSLWCFLFFFLNKNGVGNGSSSSSANTELWGKSM